MSTTFIKVPAPVGLKLKPGIKPKNSTQLSFMIKVWEDQKYLKKQNEK